MALAHRIHTLLTLVIRFLFFGNCNCATPLSEDRAVRNRIKMGEQIMKLVDAVINLLDARRSQMLTRQDWQAVAEALEAECGRVSEWRTEQERSEDERATWSG